MTNAPLISRKYWAVAFGIVAIAAMLMASRTYAADMSGAATLPDAAGEAAAPRPALA